MTKLQEKRVEQIKRYITQWDMHGTNKSAYEYKTLEIKPLDGDNGVVQFYSEVGLAGDEGTMASVFGRTIRQIFIGVNGGMTGYDHHHYQKGKKSTRLRGFDDVMNRGART